MRVTKDQLLVMLHELVEEKGKNYVYKNPDGKLPTSDSNACFYVHPGKDENDAPQPGCIAGHVFHRLGVSLDDLAQWEKRSARFVMEKLIEGPYDIAFDNEAQYVLSRAQRAQDLGWSWAEAVRKADGDEAIGFLEKYLATDEDGDDSIVVDL